MYGVDFGKLGIIGGPDQFQISDISCNCQENV